MAELDPTKFRISSALKTIIGKELITDDFIAVFELVKNSFDANAKRVDIIFENLYSENPRLIIKDDGKGMDKTDIVEKWLFLAYSAKKDGTEDYRDKIQIKRTYAGAKGIGRFSCDKLGSKLTLYAKRKDDSKVNKSEVDWTLFEGNPKDEFIKIPVKYSTVTSTPFKDDFDKGTILVIEKFREDWDREKLLQLRHSLEKLINPNQENDPSGFSIYLTVNEEFENDKKKKDEGKIRQIINGKIENRIFEDLEIKTTKIDVVIPDDGRTIQTILEDRGTLIYDIIEKNPYEGVLGDIKVSLFVLNRSAKMLFNKKMGLDAVKYGSVFLYKNGFRIYPFGEPGRDTLKIDHRKQQGTSRFFGTRDIIGRIEIYGDNPIFQETSSRDGGLIRNSSYKTLEEFFAEYVLKRLEKFAIGVIKWGNDGDLLDHETLSPVEMKKKVSDIVYHLTTSENIIDINYNPKLINIIQDRAEGSRKKILGNFQRVAEQSDNQFVAKEIRRVQRQYNSLVKAKEEAEKGEQTAKTEAKSAKETAEQKATQNLFLQSVLSEDKKDMLDFHHHIGIAAGIIEDYVKNLARKMRNGKIPQEKILETLDKINYEANLISSVSRFATKANFSLKATEIKADLIMFIKEHLMNIWPDVLRFSEGKLKNIKVFQEPDEKYICHFKPMEVVVVLDNLISNSKKAGATLVEVFLTKIGKDVLKMTISDNGKGIPSSNIDKIFELGFTTTDGSGLGLCHVKKLLHKMGGSIKVNQEKKDGAEFVITIKGI
ncbi:MAG: ATP-binding protein [Phycisphaerae bacterium]|jgi:signal transduction histidine kinase